MIYLDGSEITFIVCIISIFTIYVISRYVHIEHIAVMIDSTIRGNSRDLCILQ
jgi:hypothetical protein